MTATLSGNRVSHEARDADQPRPSVDQLINETHRVFSRFGIQVSPGRVIKLVRQYARLARSNQFAEYIATAIVLGEADRRLVADELRRCIAYADPTGETAVNHVMRKMR